MGAVEGLGNLIMITKIEKFVTDCGFEFESENEAQKYVLDRVDKNGTPIKMEPL